MQINGDIEWRQDEPGSPGFVFRTEITTPAGDPLFLNGYYNRITGKLQIAIIHRGVGRRVYGLCIGNKHGEYGRLHKHRLMECFVPSDITPGNDAILRIEQVWREFCAEANIQHSGNVRVLTDMYQPRMIGL